MVIADGVKLKRGTQIMFVPPEAKEDREHPGRKTGFVWSVETGASERVACYLWDDKSVKLLPTAQLRIWRSEPGTGSSVRCARAVLSARPEPMCLWAIASKWRGAN